MSRGRRSRRSRAETKSEELCSTRSTALRCQVERQAGGRSLADEPSTTHAYRDAGTDLRPARLVEHDFHDYCHRILGTLARRLPWVPARWRGRCRSPPPDRGTDRWGSPRGRTADRRGRWSGERAGPRLAPVPSPPYASPGPYRSRPAGRRSPAGSSSRCSVAAGRPHPYLTGSCRWASCLGACVTLRAVSIVTVALPDMGSDLSTDASAMLGVPPLGMMPARWPCPRCCCAGMGAAIGPTPLAGWPPSCAALGAGRRDRQHHPQGRYALGAAVLGLILAIAPAPGSAPPTSWRDSCTDCTCRVWSRRARRWRRPCCSPRMCVPTGVGPGCGRRCPGGAARRREGVRHPASAVAELR